jgi:hypothetical protein
MRFAILRLILIVPVVTTACQPEIGDACDVSADCAEGSDRICDPTQPAGYCTIFNCEPGSCPEEAICIAFGSELSQVQGCKDPNGGSRFRRTFCMKSCEDRSDCRSGYVCEDLSVENHLGAAVAETRSVSGRVCVAQFTTADVLKDVSTEICTGAADAGASTGGQGGSAGAGPGGMSGGGGSGESGAGGGAGEGGFGGIAGGN